MDAHRPEDRRLAGVPPSPPPPAAPSRRRKRRATSISVHDPQPPDFEHDINCLIDIFHLEVTVKGSECCMATFKRVWSEMHFSFIHQATPAILNASDYLQLVFSSAINRIDTISPFLDLDFITELSASTSRSGNESEVRALQQLSGVQLLESVLEKQKEWREARDHLYAPAHGQAEMSPHPHNQPVRSEEACPSNRSQVTDQALSCPLPPLVVRIGAVFALYALWETQLIAPKIFIYLPLAMLDLLTEVIPEFQAEGVGGREAISCLESLHESNALMIGALRRPSFQTHLKERHAQTVKKNMNNIDTLMDSSTMREALFRVRSDLGSLSELGELTAACRVYEEKRSLVFQALSKTTRAASQSEPIPHLFPPNYANHLLSYVKAESDKVNSELLPASRPQPVASKSSKKSREEAKLAAAVRQASAAEEMPISALIQSIRASPNEADIAPVPGGRSQVSFGAAPSSNIRGNLAGRSIVSSLLGPQMGSGLMGAQQLAVIRDLKRKRDAADIAEAWLQRQALLLEGDEMDSAIDEEFEKAERAEEQARRIDRPVLVWCNKKAGMMLMKSVEGPAEITCLCDECDAEDDHAGMDPKDFCIHTGLKDKGRWKDAISVDQRRSDDREDSETAMDRNDWKAFLRSLSTPKPGELPKLGTWISGKASGGINCSETPASGGSRKPRSSKKRGRGSVANEEEQNTEDPILVGFVDPEYQSLLETLNQTLSAANAAHLLTKQQANASVAQGSGGGTS